MEQEQKIGHLMASLERAADCLGDITCPTMARFYTKFPEAQVAFEYHGIGNRRKLEMQMIETVLYCIATWIERTAEIQLILDESEIHHNSTLRIRHEWYARARASNDRGNTGIDSRDLRRRITGIGRNSRWHMHCHRQSEAVLS